MTPPIRVTVWNEFLHERTEDAVRAVYPDGIHVAIRNALEQQLGDAVVVRTATQDEPEHGLTDAVLAATDVLVWWGHMLQDAVEDAVVDRVHARVLDGMGFVPLHSAHASKPFMRLMGTSCTLLYRDDELPPEQAIDRELIWTVAPGHPVAEDVEHPIVLPRHEMYGEYFDIPQPDTLIFVSAFSGGEICRSGCAFLRGKGRIFYFSPGHETFPVYEHPGVRRVLANAVGWARRLEPSGVELGEFVPKAPGWFDA